MDPIKLKILNIARRIGEFNCLFNSMYDGNVLTQNAKFNEKLIKDRDKLDIVIRNTLNGIETSSLLSTSEHKRTSNVHDIIDEIEFLMGN